jgi:hypothetical protein
MTPDWLARYRAGRRAEVWHELRQLGGAVREVEFRAEAQLVCDEMALRARRNIEVIVERLREDGYRFHTNDDEQRPMTPYVPPTSGAGEHAEWLDRTFGPLPLTILSWVRLVGDVWLVGTHPEWENSSEADPMVIELEGSLYPELSIKEHFTSTHESWRETVEAYPDHGPFVLELAPDYLHKANTSGGAPYGVQLPDACADGLFRAEAGMPFVEYLNWVFRRAGFPRATGASANEWTITHNRARDLLAL